MITMRVWKCSQCGTVNKYTEPGTMIIMAGRDTCTDCKKERDREPDYRVRIEK